MVLFNFRVHVLCWEEIRHVIRQVVPPLVVPPTCYTDPFAISKFGEHDHKGSMGRIAIVGGSKDYTGLCFQFSDRNYILNTISKP